MKTETKLLCMFTVILTVLGSTSLVAQTQNTGSIQGNIYESETNPRVPIAEAIVNVVNEESGLRRSTLTDSDGTYTIPLLIPGIYRISATRQGYENDPTDRNSTGLVTVRITKAESVVPRP